MGFKLKDIKKNRLVIFDLDDTLVKTDAKTKIISPKTGRVLKELTPDEFNKFKNSGKYIINFDDFEDPEILRSGQIIKSIFSKLIYYYKRGVPVSILTARSSKDLVRNFFIDNGIDIHPSLVIAINDPSCPYEGTIAQRKQQAIKDLVEDGYTNLIFFDDDEDNLRLAKDMEGHLGCKIKIVKVD
jgi:hydroxymethylpyrimidine pyrophosphatase-like HAD family hydrolase